MNTEEKNLVASKAFWLGLLTFAVSLGTWLQGAEFVQQWPQVTATIGMVVGVLVVVVRLLTNKAVTIRRQ